MNKKTIKYILLGIGAYAIFATSVLIYYKDNPEAMAWDDREIYNRKYIATLSIGEQLNRTHVIEKLGAPDLSEAKQTEEHNIQILFYRTQRLKSDGMTTQDECTPLLFKNDRLVAWGDSAYQQYKEQILSL